MLQATKDAIEKKIGEWLQVSNNRFVAEDFLELVAQCDAADKKIHELSEALWKLFDIRDRKGEPVSWALFCEKPEAVESMSKQGGKVVKFSAARASLLDAHGFEQSLIFDRAVNALNTSLDIIRCVSPVIANTWNGGSAFGETGSVRVVEAAIKKHFEKNKKTGGRLKRDHLI